MAIELIKIGKDGVIGGINADEIPSLTAVLPEVINNYTRTGFQEPWIAYVAVDDGITVGTCAFKTPPQDGIVEIAYFTFPQYENKGFATQMARQLTDMALATNSELRVIARTLPIDGPSASVLRKNGFVKTGEILHPEDGLVWEWEYRSATA